jgi:taurine dioxygenase
LLLFFKKEDFLSGASKSAAASSIEYAQNHVPALHNAGQRRIVSGMPAARAMRRGGRTHRMPAPAEVRAQPRLTRLAGSLGASVQGLDLSRPMDNATLQDLRAAFLTHLVLVFPGQGHITPAQHVAFARCWGPVQVMPGRHLPGHPELIEIAQRQGKRPGTDRPEALAHESARLARTDIWHSDQSYEPRPAIGSLLLAREIPSAGGDTMFANQYAAYETLSPGMQRMLRGLKALHSGEGYYRITGLDPAEAPITAHPVVRTHPETGRPALFVNRVWTTRFEDMSDEESRPLLQYLYGHAVEPCFTFRHRWHEGDLLMWDNRCVQHYAVHDYGDETRIMHRATVLGDEPY